MSDGWDQHFAKIREEEQRKQMEWLREIYQNGPPLDQELLRQLREQSRPS